MIFRISIFIVFVFAFIFGCSSDKTHYCITALDCENDQICVDGFCVDKESGNTGNSGDSGDSGDSGNSGNTSDQSDQSDQSDMSDMSDSDNTNPCDPNPCLEIALSDEICTAEGENYSCGCVDGYFWNEEKCDDIDECVDGILNDCSESADCSNTTGSYECTCRKNYSGDGFECVADTKDIPCENIYPDNASWSSANPEGMLTQTWNGTDWLPPADQCEWNCVADFAKNDTEDGCINSRNVSCTNIPANASGSGDNSDGKIFQTYTDLTGWTPGADTCSWNCNTDYVLNETSDGCINSKLAPCSPNDILNSTDATDAVIITYTTAGGWTTPAKCSWTCNTDYEQNGNSCINSKLVSCDTNNSNPANSTDIIANVTVTYTTVGGWIAPAKCDWTCNQYYKKSGLVCILACGEGNVDTGEACDSGTENADLEYNFTPTCNTNCQWNSYCGDGVENNAKNNLSQTIVTLYMDEGSGTTALDSSGSGNHGSISNASWVTGKHGQALSFNGTDSVVSLSYTPPTNNFTMMAWIKASLTHEIDPQQIDIVTGTTGQNYVFGADHRSEFAGAGVSAGTNGVSVYEHGDGYMPALAVYSGSIGTGWVHVAVTYADRQPKIYINGNLVVTGLVSAKSTVFAPTKIGGGSYGYFNGAIDGVKIIERAVTAEEIKSAMSEACDDGVLNGTSGKCKIDCTGYECVPGTYTFEYTGWEQSFIVPGPGTYLVEAWGGQGRTNGAGAVAGAYGGYAKGTLAVTTGETLYIYVGEGGGTSFAGGWNGGASGGSSPSYPASNGGGGGGASDIRQGGTTLANRKIVAGGGGGAGGNRLKSQSAGSGGGGGGGYYGGGGGGAWGGTGGGGGTQSGGGEAGLFGYIGNSGIAGTYGAGGAGGNVSENSNQSDSNTAPGGGTGGGLTGISGGSGSTKYTGGGGGGGSGYTGGVTNGSMQNGIRTGNGRVVITRTCP